MAHIRSYWIYLISSRLIHTFEVWIKTRHKKLCYYDWKRWFLSSLPSLLPSFLSPFLSVSLLVLEEKLARHCLHCGSQVMPGGACAGQVATGSYGENDSLWWVWDLSSFKNDSWKQKADLGFLKLLWKDWYQCSKCLISCDIKFPVNNKCSNKGISSFCPLKSRHLLTDCLSVLVAILHKSY